MSYPPDLKYTKDHEWIRLDGGTGAVGITDFAQRQLGDVVYVELPEVGASLTAGQVFGTIPQDAGAGAAATTVVGVATPAACAPAILGPDAVTLNLKVNGAARAVTVEPRVTLLDALRNHLDLTGAKQVCDRGGCGGCTVLLDGEPVTSCLMLAADAEGHEVTTVEGLGTPENMNAVQKAFVEKDALQCGCCTPGFVVAATAFLGKNPAPSLAEIKHGLSGNLCRCGTHDRVRRAIHRAAGDAPADEAPREFHGDIAPQSPNIDFQAPC